MHRLKKVLSLFSLLFLLQCQGTGQEHYIFFLHNRFLETQPLDAVHPEYGPVEYMEILNYFKKHEIQVISEQRQGNVNAREYAEVVVTQINQLLAQGVQPSHITVVGTSKGGYIAQYVSTIANNPALRFVFIGCYQDADLENIPDINFCGSILNIYDISDPYGSSAQARIDQSTCSITEFEEVILEKGLGHGFLFKALDEWLAPTVEWARSASKD